ncbi:hypothetical protein [Streptomyces griseorubiginosus]|uniref:hypothetical protein n=1 Tax=Streptomyces griseorubiginosus TaxID=67304 RepID=UPI001FCB19CB|nr:hypothetical protein [Streptomyces griseorubiginosus]
MNPHSARVTGGSGRSSTVLDPAVQRLVDASAGPPYLHQLGPVDGRQALPEMQGQACDDFDVDAESRLAAVSPSGLVGFWLFRPTRPTSPLPVVA